MVIPKLPKLEPWVRFPSPAPSPAMLGQAGLRDWVNTLTLWESTGNTRRFGGLPHILRYPYVALAFTRTVTRGGSQNNLCDSHALLVARAIACGWTRPLAASRECLLCGHESAQDYASGKVTHRLWLVSLASRQVPRPAAFAEYRAASALITSASTSLPSAGNRLIPALPPMRISLPFVN
jgi:hypothetical protein